MGRQGRSIVPFPDQVEDRFHGNDKCRGTMHRAQGKQKTIKQEGHNSLCPYKIEEHGFPFAWE